MLKLDEASIPGTQAEQPLFSDVLFKIIRNGAISDYEFKLPFERLEVERFANKSGEGTDAVGGLSVSSETRERWYDEIQT